jgi:hypothetical protein
LVVAVPRSHAGRPLAEALSDPVPAVTLRGSVEEALATPCDVLIDYTSPGAVHGHVLAAIVRSLLGFLERTGETGSRTRLSDTSSDTCPNSLG